MSRDSYDFDFYDHGPRRSNLAAIAALLIGFIAFILCWIPIIGIPIGHVMGIISLILSIVGLYRASKVGTGTFSAVVGLLFAVVTLVLKAIPILNLL